MKTVIIPICDSPFVVYVNGEKYTYPSGTEQEVPDEVAIVIEQHEAYHEEKARVESGEGNQGGSGGGSTATCKLKVTVVDNGMLGGSGGSLYISNGDASSIGLPGDGSAEYDVPCGSVIFMSAGGSISIENLTKIIEQEDYGWFAFFAPVEPGVVASVHLDRY